MKPDLPSTVLRTAALLKKQPVSWQRPSGGYTLADRYVVRFADGTSAFAKAATWPLTAMWLRDEYANAYARLQAPYLARMLGWEDGALPLLVLEDLSAAELAAALDRGQRAGRGRDNAGRPQHQG